MEALDPSQKLGFKLAYRIIQKLRPETAWNPSYGGFLNSPPRTALICITLPTLTSQYICNHKVHSPWTLRCHRLLKCSVHVCIPEIRMINTTSLKLLLKTILEMRMP